MIVRVVPQDGKRIKKTMYLDVVSEHDIEFGDILHTTASLVPVKVLHVCKNVPKNWVQVATIVEIEKRKGVKDELQTL